MLYLVLVLVSDILKNVKTHTHGVIAYYHYYFNRCYRDLRTPTGHPVHNVPTCVLHNIYM